ncbi:MAG: polysaccharide biosynthesis C-terminal domain-containing protein, partial [Eubacterium sp.]
YLYAIIFALMSSLMILNGILSSIANGAGELKTQAIFFGIGAVIKVPVAYFLVNILHSWIGVVIANVVAMGLYCMIQPFWLKNYLN